MRLYQITRDNGSNIAWEMEIERGFYIDLDWKSWLLGFMVHGCSVSGWVLTINLGPLLFSFYINER